MNKIAIKNIENLLFVKEEEYNQARIKAIKENKIDSEIEMWADMQVICKCLLKHLNDINKMK